MEEENVITQPYVLDNLYLEDIPVFQLSSSGIYFIIETLKDHLYHTKLEDTDDDIDDED